MCVVVAALMLAATTFGAAHGGDSHTITLSPQSADQLADGTLVVTSVASGDLAGTVTLRLEPNGTGGYDGEWAFTVAHVDNTDPSTGEEPAPHTHDGDAGHADGEAAGEAHKDFVTLVHRGSLAGSIAGATAVVDGEGQLLDIQAPLTINQGAAEFAGAHGTGAATLTGLTLTF